MKTFYILNISHKTFKEFDEVFLFDNLDMFCFFSEKFHFHEDWDVSYNTNTRNCDDYIKILNTDTNRMFIDLEKNFFDNIEDVDLYYKENIKEFTLSIYDYLKAIEEEEQEFEVGYDEDQDHKIFFPDNSYKRFYSLDSLIFFLERINYEKINSELIRIQINPFKVSFNEYVDTMMLFDPEIEFPDEVVDIDTLNKFLNAVEDINVIFSYIEETTENKETKNESKPLSKRERAKLKEEEEKNK